MFQNIAQHKGFQASKKTIWRTQKEDFKRAKRGFREHVISREPKKGIGEHRKRISRKQKKDFDNIERGLQERKQIWRTQKEDFKRAKTN